MIHAVVLAGALGVAPPRPRPWVDVGTRRLFRCRPDNSGVAVAGYCDVLRVPLDWNDPAGATIAVRFEWIPARHSAATRTIVAVDGGPGYPTTGTGDDYVRLFGPLLDDRNLLMMDERGTGASTPLDCERLQAAYTNHLDSYAFQRGIAACGVQLDRTFRKPDGRGYVRASDLFATTQSVQDLAAIVHALALEPVDLYGDSYGTFFSQAFAAAHPELVRSLTLDSAYALDQDMFDAPSRDEMRFAINAVCARSIACAGAAPGHSLDRIRRLAHKLDATSLATKKNRYDGSDLDALLGSASLDYPMFEYRELDAAARSWLDRHDAVPLARLLDRASVSSPLPHSVTAYSAAMQIADECTVYRSPFDMRAPFDERVRQFKAAIAALSPTLFDPVTVKDALADSPSPYDECLRWPAPTHGGPTTTAPPLVPPSLPVLILSGDLDSTTAPGDAERARAQLGPSARLVTIPNTAHGPAFSLESTCAKRIARAFILAPDAALDTSCTARIPEVRAVGTFPTTLADQRPAMRLPGDRATQSEARLAALAVEAIGDAIESARFATANERPCRGLPCGTGLRGGRFLASPDVSIVGLRRYAYSRDTTVIGDAEIENQVAYAGAGRVSARFIVRTNDGKVAEMLVARWDERVPRARARIDGRTFTGRTIHEEMPAP